MDPGISVLIAFVVVVVIIGWILSKLLITVHQAEGVVIERLGKFNRVLHPGLHCLIPCDTPRTFRWTRTYIDSNKRVRADDVYLIRIDKRESLFNFAPWLVFTRDTINLNVNVLMYYRIFSVQKAIYGVDDLHLSISNVAQAEIKVIFGSMTFTEALTSQDHVNEIARAKFNRDFAPWGVECTRLEIINISPQDITSRLRQQMLAERQRRAQFVIAEGNKSATRLRSEGAKIQKFQMGVAEQEAKRKRSEGNASATVKLAQAESEALTVVQQALQNDRCSQSDYKISQRYLGMFKNMTYTAQKKTIYMPYAARDIMGSLVQGMSKVYGAKAVHMGRGGAQVGSSKSSLPPIAAASKEFDELN